MGKRKIENLTDKFKDGNSSVDILQVLYNTPWRYERLIKSEEFDINPNIIRFISSYSELVEKPKREKVIFAYKEFLKRISNEESQHISAEVQMQSSKKKHITSLTDKINEYLPEDILDIFLNNPKLYRELLCSDKYDISYSVRNFLAMHKSQKTNIVRKRREYLDAFAEYQKNISVVEKDYHVLNNMVNATLNGEIHWKKGKNDKNSLFIHRTFLAKVNDTSVIFILLASRKDERDKWHTNIGLEINGVSNKVPKSNTIYTLLYKAILNNLKQQEVQRMEAKNKNSLEEIAVSHKHFVVRTNVFRCISAKHHLKEVLAIICVLTPNGTSVEEKVTAAYCQECKCFFLMTSEYERIAKKGILQCQMIEKEQFYKNGIHSIDMAGESVLMRNGYNVKANIGLTDIQRQTILANVMDNHILAASQIISYLRMFIAQKKGLESYKMAIDKWEADMQFVRLYKENSKERVFISSITKTIYRKKDT